MYILILWPFFFSFCCSEFSQNGKLCSQQSTLWIKSWQESGSGKISQPILSLLFLFFSREKKGRKDKVTQTTTTTFVDDWLHTIEVASSPTDPFTNLESRNPSIDISELYETIFWKDRSDSCMLKQKTSSLKNSQSTLCLTYVYTYVCVCADFLIQLFWGEQK